MKALATGARTGSVPRRRAGRRIAAASLEAGVFVVAVVTRLTVILRHGGLHGTFGYDAGVYFGDADALIHGRAPYRDFVLLHPPGLMLALTPFGWLTRIGSDESAFTAAVLAFAVLGAINAVLVVRLCTRLGLGRRAAAAGGLFYAMWFGAIGAEYLIKLEPLGNLLFLLALLALLRAQHARGWIFGVTAGAALAATMSVKIWWVVPVAGVIAWHLLSTDRRRRDALALGAGAVAALSAIDLPFLVLDPRGMWNSVIVDQVTRGTIVASPASRLADLSTLPRLVGPLPVWATVLAAAGVLVAFVAVARRAWRLPVARPIVVLLAVQGVVLFAAPSWFPFYCDYVAVAASLAVAAAALCPATPRARGRAARADPGWVAIGVAGLITAVTLVLGTTAVSPFAGAGRLAAAVAGTRCVMTDSPMAQIELDALSRGLADGCPNWIDVTGRTYGPDKGPAVRRDNPRWQHDLRTYLRSGQAIIIVRARGTGLDRRSRAAISRDGVLARVGRYVIYRVAPSRRG